MKKSLFFGLLIVVLFVGCNEKDPSYDFAQIYYPSGTGLSIYADDLQDSLKFATTYDWLLTTSDSWLSIDADTLGGVVPDGYYMVQEYAVNFEPNTTDTVRLGYVYFHADGKVLMTCYMQYHYLDIDRPSRRNYRYELTDSATQDRDSIIFNTYSDDWTLAFSDSTVEWVRLADDAKTTGKAGSFTAGLKLDKNETTSTREAVLQLVSAGVVCDITVKQTGKSSN